MTCLVAVNSKKSSKCDANRDHTEWEINKLLETMTLETAQLNGRAHRFRLERIASNTVASLMSANDHQGRRLNFTALALRRHGRPLGSRTDVSHWGNRCFERYLMCFGRHVVAFIILCPLKEQHMRLIL